MILTEDDAKKKWCPFARSPKWEDANGPAINRKGSGEMDSGSRCIASACMAWRWFDEESDDHPGMTHARITGDLTLRRGYCGLAGKP